MRKHTDEEQKEDTKHWKVLKYRLLTVVSKTDNKMGQKQYLKRYWEFSETDARCQATDWKSSINLNWINTKTVHFSIS